MNNFPSEQHYNLLMQGQRALNDVLPLVDKAEACGLDCSEYRSGHAFMQDRIGRYLRTFFPDQITPKSGTGVPMGD
jgi:hypothetical protein